MERSLDLSKDFHSLLKSIDKLSDGQAAVVEWDDSDLTNFVVEISPNDGLYKGGKFKFSFMMYEAESWPERPPLINCLTPIYHPNIDKLYPGDVDEDNSNICVDGIGDDWESTCSLDFCVQVVLFLFYEPNLDDPLTHLFANKPDDSTNKIFAQNVKTSLQGGTIECGSDHVVFQPNYGWVANFGQKEEVTTAEPMDVSEAEVTLSDRQCDVVEDILPTESQHNHMTHSETKSFTLSRMGTFPNMCTVTPLKWSSSCSF